MLNFDEISWLRGNSPAWRLLCADNAPLVLSFLQQVFVTENMRSISATELASRLDDELYLLNERLGDRAFPKTAKAYLDERPHPAPAGCASTTRKTATSRILTRRPRSRRRCSGSRPCRPASSWAPSRGSTPSSSCSGRSSSEPRPTRPPASPSYGGAGSSLTMRSPGSRWASLTCLTPAPSATDTSNFPQRRASCSRISARWRRTSGSWTASCGRRSPGGMAVRASCSTTCSEPETIASDQGQSFQAFYDFLLSQARQEELSGLLRSVHELAVITESDPRLAHIHHDWLDAAERTQATVRQLSEQLRRFLDDQVWFENRRVMDILRDIESRALQLRDQRQVAVTTESTIRPRHRTSHGAPAVGRYVGRVSTVTESGPPTTRPKGPTRTRCSSRSMSIPSRCAAACCGRLRAVAGRAHRTDH